ncbi:acyl-coenzyme A synthetase/AMP-(fatty) acid ligase [Kushneria sinocarnis]|uniref:Acyl-coenzyme A synthetase/AMP-(Fatty) acid ligase n=1 Tax=Kushneria sinocarnis TaxID=595502 RepID=A0A420WX63_9GAMM|nr:AMP-binding protein [Kushneria sinocarnis]RKR04339.1 acyl-coenzyme A synthetase/AMP-(fatty) acid ligase [Kushneria sinocarnis]
MSAAPPARLSEAPWRTRDASAAIACTTAETRTCQQLHHALAERQQQLRSHGTTSADIALFEPDPWQFVVSLLALWHLGHRVWLPGDDRPETRQALQQRRIPWLSPSALPLPSARATAPRPCWGPLAAEATAVVLFTSGSSGEPVPLAKRFDQLDSEVAALHHCRPLAPGCIISQVSHQHIYGLTSALLRPLCEARPFGLEPAWWPESVSRLLDTLGVSALISSPAQLSRLPESLHLSRHPHDIFSSGAPLSAEAAATAERLLAAPVTELYGSSETGGIALRRQAEGSSWQAFADVETDIRDGLLWLRSPRLDTPGQWYCHADRVAPGAGGGFHLLGRADRIAKIGGKRVSLVSMSQHLEALPEIRRAHCLVIEHAGGRVGAIVEADSAAQPADHHSRRALIDHLRTRLAEAFETTALPRFWRFVPEWPVNAQGKLTRATITRLFADLDDRRRVRWLGTRFESADHCRVTLEVPERLLQLDGHFPGRPIVPGVAQLDWVVHYCREAFAAHGDGQCFERIKFPLLLLPGERVTLTLQRHDARIGFRLDSSRGCHASGRLLIAPRTTDLDP